MTFHSSNRVLQVFSSLNKGGAESRMMDVFHKIDRERYTFDFLTMQDGYQHYEKDILLLGGKVIKIKSPRESGSISNLFSIYKVLKKGQYDAVHAHTSFHCGIVMLAGILAGVRIRISHARTTGSQNKNLKNNIDLRLGRLLIALFSNKRLAISVEAGHYLFGNASFFVIPNAIDCEKYLKTEAKVSFMLKEKYHIPQESICLGMVGRFNKMKNHSFAISVFEAFQEENANSYLIFVGDGPIREEIEEYVKTIGLSKNVIFVGVQNNVNEWMKTFDVLLVPSLFEGLGGVLLEAQAAGTPVLKSNTFTNEADMDIGLVKELSIMQGTNEWVKAIDEMLNITIPEKETIENAFYAKGYTIDAEIRKLEDIYRGF